jgi:hypothetical protein
VALMWCVITVPKCTVAQHSDGKVTFCFVFGDATILTGSVLCGYHSDSTVE